MYETMDHSIVSATTGTIPFFKCVAYNGAPEALFVEASARLQNLLLEYQVFIDDEALEGPAFVCFLSGGSEQEAVKYLRHGTLNLLVAGAGNNAWAAAAEVKAYAAQHGFQAQLIAMYDDDFPRQLKEWLQVKKAFDNLVGQKIGLIGQVSDWLVASSPEAALLRHRFGLELIELGFDNLSDYLGHEPDSQFTDLFKSLDNQQNELASVSSFLKETTTNNKLNALTLQCFRMVREKAVTACLPVALMNYNGIPAGCEGDLVSISGMMLLKELTGLIPWMANVVRVEHDQILLAHCTAPLQYSSNYQIVTHYETDLSHALQADLSFEEVTVFRMDVSLTKAFFARGFVTERPRLPHACRTQLLVKMDETDCMLLRNQPLGNHHLVLPGNWLHLIRKAMLSKGFSLLR